MTDIAVEKPADTFDLPDGEWAWLYDPRKIPERRRRPVQEAQLNMARQLPEQELPTIEVTPAPDGEVNVAMGAPPVAELQAEASGRRTFSMRDLNQESFASLNDYSVALILAFVRSWSLGAVDEDTLLDAPGDVFDALLVECRARNAGEKVVGSAAAPPDAVDPTLPSGA